MVRESFFSTEVHRYLYDNPEATLVRYRKRLHRELALQGVSLERLAGATVLDVGTGFQALVFAELGCARVYHLDIDDGQVQAVRRLCALRGIRNVTSMCRDVTAGLGGISGIDLAFVYGVLHHLVRPHHALWHLRKGLGANGSILLRCYRAQSFSRLLTAHLRELAGQTNIGAVRWALARAYPTQQDHAFEADVIDDLFVPTWGCFVPAQFEQAALGLGLQHFSPDGEAAWDFADRDENFRVRLELTGPRAAEDAPRDPEAAAACGTFVDPRQQPFAAAAAIREAFAAFNRSLTGASAREVATSIVGLYQLVRRRRLHDPYRLLDITDQPTDEPGGVDVGVRRQQRLLRILAEWTNPEQTI